jgi:hypothetical protein
MNLLRKYIRGLLVEGEDEFLPKILTAYVDNADHGIHLAEMARIDSRILKSMKDLRQAVRDLLGIHERTAKGGSWSYKELGGVSSRWYRAFDDIEWAASDAQLKSQPFKELEDMLHKVTTGIKVVEPRILSVVAEWAGVPDPNTRELTT